MKTALLAFTVFCTIFFQAVAQQFPCDGKLYFFHNDNGSNWLSYVDQYTTANPVVVNICKLSVSEENAMGANPIDHYLYFVADPNHTLYRIDESGNTVTVCSGLVPATDKGCFDNLGRYWIVDNSNNMIAYNINTCSVAKGPFHLRAVAGADIVFSVADCHFYMASATNIIEVDTNGVIVANLSPGFGGTGTFGGFAIGSDGNLYGMPDGGNTGKLYEYNLTADTSMGIVYTFPGGTANPCGCDMASFPCPSLNSNFSASASSGCGTPFTVSFNNLSSGLVNSFIWDFGDGTKDSTTLNPTHTYLQPGNYTATLSVSALTKCLYIPPNVFSSTINVFALPVVRFGPFSNPVCTTDAPFLLTGGSPVGGSYNGTGVSGNMFYPAVAGAGAYMITYNYTDGNGCSSSDSTSITVNTATALTINALPAFCTTSSPVTLVSNQAGGTFSGTGVTGNTFDPSAAGVGMFTITYSDPGGQCLSNTSVSATVTVSSAPVVTISASPTIRCLDHTIYIGYGPQSVTLTANTSGNVSSYQWYFNSVPIAEATGASINVTSAGNYNVVIADAAGCQSDTSNTSFAIQVVDIRCGHNNDKVVLCHVPPGNPDNPQTLCLPPSAVAAHLANHPGDCLGSCPDINRMAAGETETFNSGGAVISVFPNPFNDKTVIEFAVPENGNASLELYDIKGALTTKLFDGVVTGGSQNRFTVDGSNLPDGIYVSVLRTNGEVLHKKVILTR